MVFYPKTLKSAELYNENLNHFFTEKLNSMTPEQRLALPYELDYKIFRNGLAGSAEKLTFNEKFWMLQCVFGCDLVITVLDLENGLSIADYGAALKAQKGKLQNGELLNRFQTKTLFVLGGKELMSSLLYLTHVYCTSIYQLVKKHVPNADHKKNKAFVKEREAYNKTFEFIINYEANKKRITMDYGFNMPEWYCLLYFASNEGWAQNFYNRDLKYAYNSNNRDMHAALQKMYKNGYLTRRKFGIKDKYTLSAKGMEMINRIFANILLKF